MELPGWLSGLGRHRRRGACAIGWVRHGSDKIEVRLGGIYTLERISRESPDDYWTVMETLCAFVRERARWKAPEEASSETVARFYNKSETTENRRGPPTDISAVLAVICRRDH